MSHSDSAIHWALSKLASHMPFSHTDSSLQDALLAILSSPSTSKLQILNRQPGQNLVASRQLTNFCDPAAQRLFQACVATGRVDFDEFNRLIDSWDDILVKQTRIWAEDAFSSVRSTIASVKSTPFIRLEKKPTFNHEYTPSLEKYFDFNAYPSAPDRAILARKSMMSPRQIEVWFQNHRNRAKKEGRALRRLPSRSAPSDRNLALETLEKEMPYFAIPEHERRTPKSQRNQVNNVAHNLETSRTLHPCSSPDNTFQHIVMDPPRPPYAFPAVYSQCTPPRTLGQEILHKFPPPMWQRKPANCSPITKTHVDIHELVLDFNQKLHLRTASTLSSSQASQSWYSGRTVIPCSAPLPALIRPCPCFPVQTLVTPPLTLSLSKQAPQILPARPRRQKVVVLPKGTSAIDPSLQGCNVSDTSPPTSPSSSRSSSFCFEASPRRLSSSSRSSVVSSALTTPEHSSSLLPEDDCFAPGSSSLQ